MESLKLVKSVILNPTDNGVEMIEAISQTKILTAPTFEYLEDNLVRPVNVKLGEDWLRLPTVGSVYKIKEPVLVTRANKLRKKLRSRKNQEKLVILQKLATGKDLPVLPDLGSEPQKTKRVKPRREKPRKKSLPVEQEKEHPSPSATPHLNLAPPKTVYQQKPLSSPGGDSNPAINTMVKPPAKKRRIRYAVVGLVLVCIGAGGAVGITSYLNNPEKLMPSHVEPTQKRTATQTKSNTQSPSADNQKTDKPTPPPEPTPEQPTSEPSTPATTEVQPAPQQQQPTIIAPQPEKTVYVERPTQTQQPQASQPAPPPQREYIPDVSTLHTRVSAREGTVVFTATAQGANPPAITASIAGRTITLSGGTGTLTGIPAGTYTWTTQCGILTNTGTINVS